MDIGMPRYSLNCIPMKRGVQTAERQQFTMSPGLHDPTLVDHDDPIRTFDRGQAMRDDQRGASAHQQPELGLHAALGFVVERRGGLIEHQNGESLRSARAIEILCRWPPDRFWPRSREHGFEAQRLLRDEFHHIRGARRGFDVRVALADRIERDVVVDGVIEQHHLLAHQADLRTQIGRAGTHVHRRPSSSTAPRCTS